MDIQFTQKTLKERQVGLHFILSSSLYKIFVAPLGNCLNKYIRSIKKY